MHHITGSPQLPLPGVDTDPISDAELRQRLWPVSVDELHRLYAARVTRVSAQAMAVVAVVHSVAGAYVEQREIARRASLSCRRPVGLGTVARVLAHLRAAGVLASDGGRFRPWVGRASCQVHHLRGCAALLEITPRHVMEAVCAYRRFRELGWSDRAAFAVVRRGGWRRRLDGAELKARARALAERSREAVSAPITESASGDTSAVLDAGVPAWRVEVDERPLSGLLGAVAAGLRGTRQVSEFSETESRGVRGVDQEHGLSPTHPRHPQHRADADEARIVEEARRAGYSAGEAQRNARQFLGWGLRRGLRARDIADVAVQHLAALRVDQPELRRPRAWVASRVFSDLAAAVG